MFIERRKLIRRTDLPRERRKADADADAVLAHSKHLIEEIDVLLKHSRELTSRPIR
jgi:hypothetical protein